MGNPIISFLRNVPRTYHPGWGQGEYTSWQDEQMSWKTTCYLGDWSFLWEARFEGPGALDLFRDSSVNSFEDFPIGKAKHVVQCNEDGKVSGEGILMRLAEDVYTTQGPSAFWSAYIASQGRYDVTVTQPKTFQFQVSGPTALAACQKATGEDLTDIPFMSFRSVTIAGKHAYALRQGMAGEPGFEFHGDAEDAEVVRAALLEAGEEFGMRRLGRRTAMINHLEASFPTPGWHFMADFYSDQDYTAFFLGNFDLLGLVQSFDGSLESDDLNDYLRSPYELGWGRYVKFDHDFTGRAVLEREAAEGPAKVRVTLEWDSEDVIDIYRSLFEEGPGYKYLEIPHEQRWVGWADEVRAPDGTPIGVAGIPGYSTFFRRVLALAFIAPEYSEPGTQVEFVWGSPGTRQKIVRATVAPAPYKTDRRRAELAVSQAS